MTSSGWVTVVATIVAATGLAFTVYSATRAKSRKLAWATLYNASILEELPRSLAKDMRVLSGEIGLARPRVIVVELSNVGNVELKKEDISLPITVDAGVCKIVSAHLLLRPRSAGTSTPIPIATLSGTAVEAAAVVLNPGDSLVFELLVDGDGCQPGLTMQAAGFAYVNHPANMGSWRTKAMTAEWSGRTTGV